MVRSLNHCYALNFFLCLSDVSENYHLFFTALYLSTVSTDVSIKVLYSYNAQ